MHESFKKISSTGKRVIILFTFFKNKNASEVRKTGLDHTVSSHEILSTGSETGEQIVTTKLSYPSHWNVSKEDEYVFRFLHNELEPLYVNQISLAGVEIEKGSTSIKVTAFVRNSLSKMVKLGPAEILLLNSNKEIVARKTFDLSEIKGLPPHISRPWIFTFEEPTWENNEFSTTDWTLAFNLSSKTKHRLDLDTTWNNNLTARERQTLENIVKTLPSLKPKEFNITGIEANVAEDGDLHVTALFRNGNTSTVQIQTLPLELFDTNNEKVAKATFKLKEFEIQPHTSKPWTFIFPVDLVTKKSLDLNTWSIKPVVKN
jgi:accessory Sec system S-layer assembly protein